MADPGEAPEQNQESPAQEPKKTESKKEVQARTKKEIKKDSKKQRDKLKALIKKLEANYRDNPYRFFLNQVTKTLLKPAETTDKKAKAEIERIENMAVSDDEKIKLLGELKVKTQKEIESEIANSMALLRNFTKDEYEMITRTALAKLERYAPILVKMAESPKGEPLVKIFATFIELPTLGNLRSGTGKDYAETVEKGVLDPDTAEITYTMLSFANQKVRDEFTVYFIDKHPGKAMDFLEKGSQYGCYSANKMEAYFMYCEKNLKSSNPKVAEEAAKKVKNFDKDRKSYEIRYKIMAEIKKRARNLRTKDAKNPALQMMTFKQGARFVGYLASILTIGANLLANRHLLKDDFLEAMKNPYLWAGVGTFGYLYKTGKEERLKDSLAGKGTRERRKELSKMAKLKSYMDNSAGWGRLFNNGGEEMMIGYENHLAKQKTIVGKMPYTGDFTDYCKEHETATSDDKKPSVIFAKMEKDDKDGTQNELEEIVYIFRDLGIKNKAEFRKKVKEADQKLS